MRSIICFFISIFFCCIHLQSQVPVSTAGFNNKSGVVYAHSGNLLSFTWPTGNNTKAKLVINLDNDKPLIDQITLLQAGKKAVVVKEANPAFVLTIGKRDLISQNGWNIFFDKVPLKPHQSYKINIEKRSADVRSSGISTVISIGEIKAAHFTGNIEFTLYNGSPLINIAAVMATQQDSVAIVYDAGLISNKNNWNGVHWAGVDDKMKTTPVVLPDTAIPLQVKYRTIIANNENGSIAVFPAPHKYFYPLDEAFNLSFTWYGNQYNKMLDGYGIGIRQDLQGDKRYVPWFNAPPNTKQRMGFFCYVGMEKPAALLEKIKTFTHADRYVPLPGYKTMSSHFHNEYVMKVLLAGKPQPDTPNFVKVFKTTGIDIVHLAEFHYTAHPKGPDDQRLNELKTLFDMCKKYSDKKFLLLPGEEPNEFFGGHWLQFFPKPVYWIMSRKENESFASFDKVHGQIYHVGNAAEMLKLLEEEKGLAWTAHPRTKGSTGFPDAYKNESFFLSDRFLGAAWKAMPADLSQPVLGKRVLDLMDDMNNWGLKKKVLAEADLFTVEPENEMYAHLNVNYLQLKELPQYKNGWQPVLDALQQGQFFSTTGEILIPSFTINNKASGQTALLSKNGMDAVSYQLNWTFPLNYAEIISGDGVKVYRDQVNLNNTAAFGNKVFKQQLNLHGRKWARLEVWDIAGNGAFTQTVGLKE
ncbi:MAG: hypothetical protein QM726_19790 [Chitinophagaceae bacterium]